MGENGLRQVIHRSVPFELETLGANDLHAAMRAFLRPFDLSEAPLIRAALWHESGTADVLFIDMHHIIGDGLSTATLLRQLDALYRGESLQLPSVDFKDYAYWYATHREEVSQPLKEYWKDALAGLEGPPDIPTDFPRPKQFDFKGDKITVELPAEQVLRLNAFCKERELSPYMLFTAAFALFLAKVSGSTDIVLGAPVAGRHHSELMQVVGAFIQTLPLRLKPRPNMDVSQYLDEVKSSVLGLLDHQQMPLEDIIALTDVPRETGRHALYNTILNMRPLEESLFALNGQQAQAIGIPTHTAKMDLVLDIETRENTYVFEFEYAASLFHRRTVELWSRSFIAVLNAILKQDSKDIASIDAVDVRDRIFLIENPNYMRTPFIDLPVDRQVERMAQLMPDAPAVVFQGQTTTYAQLMRRAGHIAGRLAHEGVQKGDVIAFALKRGADLVAAMMAIVQSGCAYMPMLASFPHNRLRYMAEISDAKLVLCDAQTVGMLPDDWPCRPVLIEGETAAFVPPADRSGDDIMHVLFTSGSTAAPRA
jgi:non-ribosomal peptide synthetase component F